MRVRVLCFALARQVAGTFHLEVEVGEPPLTVAALREAIAQAQPALRPLLPHLRLAIDGAFIPDDSAIVDPAAEIALIPPVSGG